MAGQLRVAAFRLHLRPKPTACADAPPPFNQMNLGLLSGSTADAAVHGSSPPWLRDSRINPCRRYHGLVTTKERLHKLVDELSEQEAEAALVIVERRRDDPMLHALASAPLDDEPSDADEDASAAEALAAHNRGESISSEQLRAELDLD